MTPVKTEIDEKLMRHLSYAGFCDSVSDAKYSAKNVIDEPTKYPEQYELIKKANLNHPIIITKDGNVIDGIHRLSKAYLLKKKYINAYVFDSQMMKKFIIAKRGQWAKADQMKTYQLITLYVDRFRDQICSSSSGGGALMRS